MLVHGDLHVRHLLVDAAGVPAGVIDRGDVSLAGYAAADGRPALLAGLRRAVG